MVSSLDTLDPITAVQMESLEHQSTSEHYSHDYEVQEPDSDTERLVSDFKLIDADVEDWQKNETKKVMTKHNYTN